MVDMDAFITLPAQTNKFLLGLSNKFDVAPVGINIVQNHFLVIEHCGESHASNTCGSNPEIMNYINNQYH